jgi:flagellar biosynthesis activator protein FlaF
MSQTYHAAYSAHQRKDETVRETEAHALLSCASRLEAARDETTPKEEFAAALRHNQDLWTLFQACLCEMDNPLPQELKVLLLNISRYIDKVTFRALAENDRSLLRSLISINRNIASGLRKNAAAETSAAKAPVMAEDAPPPSIMTSA